MTGRASCVPWSGWRCGPRRRLEASRGSGSGGCSPGSCSAPQPRGSGFSPRPSPSPATPSHLVPSHPPWRRPRNRRSCPGPRARGSSRATLPPRQSGEAAPRWSPCSSAEAQLRHERGGSPHRDLPSPPQQLLGHPRSRDPQPTLASPSPTAGPLGMGMPVALAKRDQDSGAPLS